MTTNTPSEQPAIPEGMVACRKCGGAGVICFSSDDEVSWVRCSQCGAETSPEYRVGLAIGLWNHGKLRTPKPAIPASAGGAEARATQMLASRGWFPSAASLPFDVAHSLITAALPVKQPAQASEVERAVEAAQYLIDTYERLWKGGISRDLAEAIAAWQNAAAVLNPSQERAEAGK